MEAITKSLIVSMSLIVATGCLSSPGALAPCDAQSQDRPICRLTNPEDLGFLPDHSWVIVSEMAPSEAASDEGEDEGEGETAPEHGRLTALRLLDLERQALYPASSDAETDTSNESSAGTGGEPDDWGNSACPGAPDPMLFKPHGIDVARRRDGRHALAVVNHGGREAVELFEILDGSRPSLAWRGCVPMPEDVMANDVAFLPGDGFVVTNFMPRIEGVGPRAIWSVLKMSMGARTGSVLKWEPGREPVEIENSGGSAPNGIAVSPDGSEIFVAEWGAGRIYRLKLDGEGAPERDEVEVDHHPDNFTWTREGQLLVAGQYGGVANSLGCSSIRNAGCDLGYSVYRIDPEGLEATKIVEGRGAVSVALEVEDELFIGAFIGDQIMRVPRPD